MTLKKNITELLFEGADLSFIDVRSPSEFKKGHIPGAHNIPLLSDDLRALVGTIYVQEGKEKAMHVAMELIAPNFTKIIDHAKKIYNQQRLTLVVYCARGGMRSASVSWLFNLFQLPVIQLEQGYKGYRNWVILQFLIKKNLNLISGKTGSGKTAFLQKLKYDGAQIVDLEGVAQHKGSVFGGEKNMQITQQQFENDLAWQWSQLVDDKSTWIEDESRKIGSIIIPEGVWLQMKNAPAYLLDISFEKRLDRIMEEYGALDKIFLLRALDEIKEHLGGARYVQVQRLILSDHIKEAARILLQYYDKKYEHGLKDKTIVSRLK